MKSLGLRAALAVADPTELVLEIYGTIGESFFGEGITAQQVADALKGAHEHVTVRINSPGGNAMDGIAIYNLLKTSGKPVRVIVDGMAASAGSLIAMAGDVIEMGEGTLMMIHPAQLMVYGSSVKMRAAAELLEKATGNMADIYAARSKGERDVVLEMLYAETWMNPQEALAKGFATKVTGDAGQDAVKSLASAYNLAAFEKAPEELKALYNTADKKPGVSPDRIRLELQLKRLKGVD